jgi:hypothetical protein
MPALSEIGVDPAAAAAESIIAYICSFFNIQENKMIAGWRLQSSQSSIQPLP